MSRVSKNRLVNKSYKGLFIDDFYSAVTSLKDKTEVKNFFEDLLTTEEKLMLAKRFQVALMLKLGYLWEEIDKRVKVTQGTIARLNYRLNKKFSGLINVVERIISLKQKKLRSILNKKEKEFLGLALVKAGIGAIIQRKRKIKKEKSIISN